MNDDSVALQGRLVGNTLAQLPAPALRMGLGLVLGGMLSRYLGVDGFGAYALVFAYVGVFNGVVGDWGIGMVCLREISKHPEQRGSLLKSAAALQVVICGLTYALLLLVLLALPYPGAVKAAIAVYGLTVFIAPADIIALPFQAELRLARVMPPSLLGIALNFVFTVAVILLHGPLILVVAAAVAAMLISYVWLMVMSMGRLRGGDAGPVCAHWGYLAREAWPLGVATILTTATQQAPLLALSALSFASLGLFNAASRLPLQMMLIPMILRTSTFPLLSRFWALDRPRFRALLDRLLTIVLLGALPLSLLLAGLAHPVVRLLFGSAFDGAAVPFIILVLATALMMPAILVGEALIAAHRQRLNLAIQCVAAVLLGGLLLGLVPRLGAIGAAASLAAMYAFVLAAQVGVARRVLAALMPLRALFCGALAAGAGGGALLLVNPFSPLLAGPVAAVLAVATLLALLPAPTRQSVMRMPALLARGMVP